MNKGEVFTGPSFTVAQPHDHVTMTITDGVKIYGPVIFILCDGHLTITKP